MRFLMQESFSRRGQVYVTPGALELLELSVLFRDRLEDALDYLTTDLAEIRYRNDLFRDLMEQPALLQELSGLYQALRTLMELRALQTGSASVLLQSLQIMQELPVQMQRTAGCIRDRRETLRCPGFARLADTLSEYVRSAFPESSMQKWERYTRGLSQPVSLTYRVVFNDDLHIAKAALVRVDDAPYTTQSKLTRIMHWQYPGSMDMPTQSLFAKRAGIQDEKPGPIELYSLHAKDENRLLLADERTEIRRDIFSVLREALGQLERAQTEQALVQLRAFARQATQEFQNLTAELHFLLGCMGVIQDLRDGLYPICFAEPCPPQQRTLQAQEAFHPLLAYREQATRNPVDFAAWGELLLLSGVNTGGKTTYLQTVGCLQLFLQLGLPVPAQSARISVADAIALAFSMDETEAAGRGKLGLELAQLKEAIFHTGADSLVLFNEPLTGASPGVCAQLMRELLAVVKLREARGLWVTHQLDVVARYGLANACLPGSRLGSIFVSLREGRPDYAIRTGVPERNRYASELFARQ